jgi:hypothetical protein
VRPDDLRLEHLTQEWLATSDDPQARTSGVYWYHQRPERPTLLSMTSASETPSWAHSHGRRACRSQKAAKRSAVPLACLPR